MACIRARKKKDGTVSYQAIVRITGQPTLRETFAKREQAVKWSDAMTAAGRASATTLPNPKAFRRINLAHAVEDMIANPRCPKSYVKMAPSIIPHIKDISIGRITQGYVDELIDTLRHTNSQKGKPYADTTISRYLTILRQAVKRAGKKHGIKVDLEVFSLEDVEGKWQNERDRVLSFDEEQRLRSALSGRRYSEPWSLLLDLAIETCAREQELILAEPREFNLETRVWTIPKEHTKMKYPRDVPLSEKAYAAVLRLHKLLDERNEMLSAKDPEAKKESRLFWRFESPSSVSTGFSKFTKQVGIADLCFHDLRHTAITRIVLYKREMTIPEIMKLAGHRTIGMFIRYANLRAEDMVKKMQ